MTGKLRDKTRRAERILRRRYGQYEWSGPSDVLDAIVHTILSQNTNDVNSARAFRSLRRKFPTWTKVMKAPIVEVADAIKVGGLWNNKSRWIQGLLRWVKETHGRMSLEHLHTMTPQDVLDEMGHLPGIGVKTVYVTLMFACGQDVFPVDTHVYRVTKRLGLIPERISREEAHNLLGRVVTGNKMYSFHINLIRHGRSICTSRNPKCEKCPLKRLCPRII